MKEDFIIPLDRLNAGKTSFDWHIGKEFFREFDNSDILDSDLSVVVTIEKSGKYTGIDCSIDGTMTVPCDRCLDDLTLEVSKTVRLSVKFGSEPTDSDSADMTEGDREIVYLPEEEASMDLAQVIYDYSMLSLPMQKVHPEGKCNPVALKYLVSEINDPDEREDSAPQDSDNNPFAALKGLFDNN